MSTDLFQQLQTALGVDYLLERELGGGGMSRVFLAEERCLGRRMVVKVLDRGQAHLSPGCSETRTGTAARSTTRWRSRPPARAASAGGWGRWRRPSSTAPCSSPRSASPAIRCSIRSSSTRGSRSVSRSMSSLIERGETSPAAVVLEKLATGLGVRATRRSAVTGAWAGVRVGVIPDYALLPGGGFCDTTVYYRRLDPVSSGAPVTG